MKTIEIEITQNPYVGNDDYRAAAIIKNPDELGLTIDDADFNGDYPIEVIWEITNYDLFNEGDGDCCDWDNPASISSPYTSVQKIIDACDAVDITHYVV